MRFLNFITSGSIWDWNSITLMIFFLVSNSCVFISFCLVRTFKTISSFVHLYTPPVPGKMYGLNIYFWIKKCILCNNFVVGILASFRFYQKCLRILPLSILFFGSRLVFIITGRKMVFLFLIFRDLKTKNGSTFLSNVFSECNIILQYFLLILTF